MERPEQPEPATAGDVAGAVAGGGCFGVVVLFFVSIPLAGGAMFVGDFPAALACAVVGGLLGFGFVRQSDKWEMSSYRRKRAKYDAWHAGQTADRVERENALYREEVARQREEDERMKRVLAERQHKELVQRHKDLVTALPDRQKYAEGAADDAARKVQECEARLKEANRLYQGGYYSPFWEAIEQAVSAMTQAIRCVESSRDRLKELADNVSELVSAGQGSRVPHGSIRATISRTTAKNDDTLERLPAAQIFNLAMRAQQNFEYAAIYEARRTTSAVVAGFGSLQQAMSWHTFAIEQALEKSRETYVEALNELGFAGDM